MNTKQELFSSSSRPVSPAHTAIRAAKMRRNVGSYSSRLFCTNRGVSLRVYRIACQCEATKELF